MEHRIAFICTLSVCAGSASADITVYTDRGLWEEAAGGPVFVEDFNAQTPGIIAPGATLDTGLIQIMRDGEPNGSDGLLEIEPGGNFGNLDGSTFLSGETGVEPHEIVNIMFGASANAFGADWFSPFSGDGIALKLGDDVILLDQIAGFDSGFVGIVSDGPLFNSIQIVGNPGAITFQELWSADNVSFAVPSPAAASLFSLGALTMTRRKR
jgi:hypothetical protein